MGNGQKTLHKIRELAEVARGILRGTLRVIRHLVCLFGADDPSVPEGTPKCNHGFEINTH